MTNASSDDTSTTLRILIIESAPDECERLLDALRGGGHTLEAHSAFSLSELAAALMDAPWSIILLNSGLKNLPASETLDTIRVADKNVPVVLVIDRGSQTFPTELLESGAQDFVFKSNLSRLLPVVDRECVDGLLRREGEKSIQAVRDAASALGESEARFLQLAGNIPECFWLADAESRQFTYISKAYEQIWGSYVEALYADPKDWLKYIHPDDRERVVQATRMYRRGGLDEKFRVIRADGSIRWLHARNFAIRNDDGRVVSIAGVASDISSFIADQRQVAHLARVDPLTALPNQIAFYDRLQNLIALARRNGMQMAVMIIDIDRFHTVNETLGHVVGDELLRQIAGRLSGSLREGDTVGRLGGDVFGAILTDTFEVEQAHMVTRRIVDILAMPVLVDGHEWFATASIGVAFFPADGDERHTLVRNAELAMRRAKLEGRNNVQFFAQSQRQESQDRLFLEVDLRSAASRDEFVLVYQPKVSCQSGRISGIEALLRWQHPRRGLVLPEHFIPLLEDTGIIIQVGRWVLQTACMQAMAWRTAGLDLPGVAVNLSARQLQSETLCHDVAEALAASGLPADCLELELTESMLMQQAATAVQTLAALKALGVRISLDDFGTGYSSLAYLKRFPLDSVKVDRAFVQDITADADDASITRAVITMAHHLKLTVVAEGVETEGQAAMLIAHHCDIIQGYFFSPPLAAPALEKLLIEDRRFPPALLRSGIRKPLALFAGVEGYDDVLRQLERAGHRVSIAANEEMARQWLQGNLADVLVCGPDRVDFNALRLLHEARERQPHCERFILADARHWQTLGHTGDGSDYRLLLLPVPAETLRHLVEEALLRRQMSDDFERVSQQAEIAARELVRIENERRRLDDENRRLAQHESNGYAILQEVVHLLPWPVLGIDQDGMVAMVNEAALAHFSQRVPVVGASLAAVLPEAPSCGQDAAIAVDGVPYRAMWRRVDSGGAIYGHLLLLERGDL